jgi:hypothetical protein
MCTTAGIPPGNLLTWTIDGKNVLLQSQSDSIWELSWKKNVGHLIAPDAQASSIYDWIDDTHLLIKVIQKPKGPSKGRPYRRRHSRILSDWAILSLGTA